MNLCVCVRVHVLCMFMCVCVRLSMCLAQKCIHATGNICGALLVPCHLWLDLGMAGYHPIFRKVCAMKCPDGLPSPPDHAEGFQPTWLGAPGYRRRSSFRPAVQHTGMVLFTHSISCPVFQSHSHWQLHCVRPRIKLVSCVNLPAQRCSK